MPGAVQCSCCGKHGANSVGPVPAAAAAGVSQVVLTLMGQEAKDIYKNQKSIRDEVAQAAGEAWRPTADGGSWHNQQQAARRQQW